VFPSGPSPKNTEKRANFLAIRLHCNLCLAGSQPQDRFFNAFPSASHRTLLTEHSAPVEEKKTIPLPHLASMRRIHWAEIQLKTVVPHGFSETCFAAL
jgi:hypothetical protein